MGVKGMTPMPGEGTQQVWVPLLKQGSAHIMAGLSSLVSRGVQLGQCWSWKRT